MTENWACIDGYVGRYAVSDHGNVMSMDFRRSGLPGLLRGNDIGGGYLQVRLGRKTVLVHRLVAAAFIGPCPDGMEVNHKDGDPSNSKASNLEYLTHAENILHAFRTGLATRPIGEKNPAARLTEAQVKSIRDLLARGDSPAAIAHQFDVARRTISAIKTGQNWSKGEQACL